VVAVGVEEVIPRHVYQLLGTAPERYQIGNLDADVRQVLTPLPLAVGDPHESVGIVKR
jgi:hypothetical protein